jgi:hypothetical protein
LGTGYGFPHSSISSVFSRTSQIVKDAFVHTVSRVEILILLSLCLIPLQQHRVTCTYANLHLCTVGSKSRQILPFNLLFADGAENGGNVPLALDTCYKEGCQVDVCVI